MEVVHEGNGQQVVEKKAPGPNGLNIASLSLGLTMNEAVWHGV